jgi:hypothetical protein
MSNLEANQFVEAELVWLIDSPPTNQTAGLTGYRKQEGLSDLFSIYVRFSNRDATTSHWRGAKIFALVSEMEDRLPAVGQVLVITAGHTPAAEAKVINTGREAV